MKKEQIQEIVKTSSLQKLVVAINEQLPEGSKLISYTTFLRAVSAPVPGEVFDPSAVNVSAIEELLKGKKLTLNVFDCLDVDALTPEKTAREINFVIGDKWTHRNYLETVETGEIYTTSTGRERPVTTIVKDENGNDKRQPLEIVAFTSVDVCVKNLVTDTLHAMSIQTFRQGAPEQITG